MQLQRSLYSFYNVFIRKTPLLLWATLTLLLVSIICWQVGTFYTQQQAYNFDKCMMQFFNATRMTSNSTDIEQKTLQQQSKQQNSNSNSQTSTTTKQQLPFYLEPKYYHILNQTTIAKIYLSDDIPYSEGEANCRIVLNTQRIKSISSKQEEDTRKSVNSNSNQPQGEKLNDVTRRLQQQANQHQPNLIQNSDQQQQQQPLTQRPPNIKDHNEITLQQQKFLLSSHPFMHLTSNSHIIYLDQNNQFLEKHGVQTHAIILSKQQFNQYPQSVFGISSKYWRFHGNNDIERNAITLKSMAETFEKVMGQVKEVYLRNVEAINMIISLKRFIEGMGEGGESNTVKKNQTQSAQKNDIVVDDQETKKNHTTPQQPPPNNTNPQQSINISIIVNSSPTPNVHIQLPSTLIQPQQIYPLSQLKLYFHYPQILRVQQIAKLVNTIYQPNGVLFKVLFGVLSFCHLYLISWLVGLVVRYALFWIMTLYLFLGGCFVTKQWGWVTNFTNLIYKRDHTHPNVTTPSSFKMLLFFTLSLIGILTIFTLGSKYIIQNLFIYSLTFSENYYSEMLLKNLFIIQLYYYVCCRSRVTLRFFPVISMQVSLLVLYLNERLYCWNICWLVNMHLLVHLLLMTVFACVQNHIKTSEFHSQHTPSQQKPRAMYFIGYDITWQNSIPPIWTYFTTQFDLKCFNQKERALVNRDYQLLYGRLLGMNDRQELPEDEEQEREEEVGRLNQNLYESNQLRLIN